MNRIVLDDTIRAYFPDFNSQAEVCDEKGRLLGYYVPAAAWDLYAQVNDRFSDAELDRASQEAGGRPLQEILRDLERGL